TASGSPVPLADAPTVTPSARTRSLVGHVACLGHGGGGHTSWHCRTCDAVVYGPTLAKHCTPRWKGLRPCGSRRRRLAHVDPCAIGETALGQAVTQGDCAQSVCGTRLRRRARVRWGSSTTTGTARVQPPSAKRSP